MDPDLLENIDWLHRCGDTGEKLIIGDTVFTLDEGRRTKWRYPPGPRCGGSGGFWRRLGDSLDHCKLLLLGACLFSCGLATIVA
jgi:hypothetical protein